MLSPFKTPGHKGLPATLATWLDEKDKKGFLIRDPVNLRISLGPNNSSYWAYDGKSSLWWNLPSDLSTAIDKLRKKGGGWTIAPRIVALGVQGSFVMINSRHGCLRNIESHYPQLHSELDTLSGKFDQIHHISLDQHDPANFVLTLTNGSAGWQIPDEMDEALAKIVNSIPKGAPAAARPVAQQRKSSGIGSALLKAVVKGTIMGLAGAGQQQQQGGGGGGGGFVDMSAFTAGLQQNMWSSVDSAASMPIQ